MNKFETVNDEELKAYWNILCRNETTDTDHGKSVSEELTKRLIKHKEGKEIKKVVLRARPVI